ncbi:ATP-binding protein [Sporanaerobacter acetigenes]|uniref:ATP-binding protein n=1 Tax=Sporanaerobacter acetigenes TaxID=165813 RepID=UPI00104A860B|nr:AAA family ATPase [Sporanaerobacter acetigenes]
MEEKRIVKYPFSAIVGQEEMKKALILNIINPSIGGVLIRGEKGTAKSTAVRGITELLPLRKQVKACPFSCDPEDESKMCRDCRERLQKEGKLEAIQGKMKVIELPINATEDRVAGTLNIETAIKKGEKKFEPGILASANRNILYVDEVNLLEDHVVDMLLDAAAMGVNTVEREGISFSHPSRFILVGTMNPEEGDLRPQLIDRFGLVVDVVGERETNMRMNVVKRRIEYERNPEKFLNKFKDEEEKLKERIMKAISILDEVEYDDEIIEKVSKACVELDIDGHRGDIVAIKTAMTIAAFDGRKKVEKEDLLESLKYVLPHRMRRRPFEKGTMDFSIVEKIILE